MNKLTFEEAQGIIDFFNANVRNIKEDKIVSEYYQHLDNGDCHASAEDGCETCDNFMQLKNLK